MAHLKLNAEQRSVTGKKVSRLRRDGVVPVVVYGGKLDEAISLQIDARHLLKVLGQAGTSTVIDLEVAKDSYPVLTREVQRDPVRNDITHVDFLAVRLDVMIQAEVSVVIIGESPTAENNQGILSLLVDNVTVEALPDRLPSSIEVDVSGLVEIGDTISAGDLPLDESVTLISDPEMILVLLSPPARAIEEDVVDEDEELLEGEEALDEEASEAEGESDEG